MEIRRIITYADGGDLDATRRFYVDVLGMRVGMEDPVLGLHAASEPSAQVLVLPPGMTDPQPRFGVDVGTPEAVDAVHAAAVELGLKVVYPLTDEPWGVRRFFVEDPNGTVVDVLGHRDGS